MFAVEKHCLSLCSLIISTFVIFSIDVESQEMCNESFTRCCSGYFWNNKTNSCELCRLGYVGINCTISCPYPTYGRGCQGLCDCDEDMCDVSTGCEPNTTACTPGYIGINCTIRCTYPLYGHGCQSACDCEEGTCDVSTGCGPITTEPFNKSLSETNQILLCLIKMVGSTDIILLSTYVVICIHDRKRRKMETEFSSPGQQYPGPSTTYENIEVVSFPSAQ